MTVNERLKSRPVRIALFGALVAGLAIATSPAIADSQPRIAAPPLAAAFGTAADKHGVPRDLLVALGHAETHLDGHAGAPSASNGYGVMHLASNPQNHTLDEAARLTGMSLDELRTTDTANILGAAAVLRGYADAAKLSAAQRSDVNTWYGVIARYGGAPEPALQRLYADAVYDVLTNGLAASPAGLLRPRKVAPQRGDLAGAPPVGGDVGIQSTDYAPAHWVPAVADNYTVANRPSSGAITHVVIHVTQGSYAGTISWIRNSSSNVSAHYVIRSSDGDVTQMVREKDIAWHARSGNPYSIGIEHEGFVNNPSWFTDAMYRSSAALTRHLTNRYGIPKTRSRIVGHVEVPGNDHTDPGPHWNWNYYMQLVTGGDGGGGGWTATVDNETAGSFTASANWGTSGYSSQRHGANYRFASPLEASDPAWYRFTLPATAAYRVDVWYADDPGYNDRAPYIVAATGGNQVVYVDQRVNGGRWVTIGTFNLASGAGNKVAVSRWTGGAGLIIADAIRVTRV
jgi:hypothetical protein